MFKWLRWFFVGGDGEGSGVFERPVRVPRSVARERSLESVPANSDAIVEMAIAAGPHAPHVDRMLLEIRAGTRPAVVKVDPDDPFQQENRADDGAYPGSCDVINEGDSSCSHVMERVAMTDEEKAIHGKSYESDAGKWNGTWRHMFVCRCGRRTLKTHFGSI